VSVIFQQHKLELDLLDNFLPDHTPEEVPFGNLLSRLTERGAFWESSEPSNGTRIFMYNDFLIRQNQSFGIFN
jgi:hypothetical protein